MTDDPRKPSLLSKTNPVATPRSVVVHSLWGACGGAILGLVMVWGGRGALWSVMVMALLGALAAGAIEWQLDDSDDDAECP